MNMVFEGLKQKGSMVIVPSTAVETMGLGALGGLASFGQLPDGSSGPDARKEMIHDERQPPRPSAQQQEVQS